MSEMHSLTSIIICILDDPISVFDQFQRFFCADFHFDLFYCFTWHQGIEKSLHTDCISHMKPSQASLAPFSPSMMSEVRNYIILHASIV